MRLNKRIYLIRHGETEYNKIGKVQGCSVDAPLNNIGQAQARAFYDAYQHISFDKIYTSGLKRTNQTVENFKQSGVPIEQHAGLNEINWGDFEGLKVSATQKNYYQNLLKEWRSGNTHIPIKGGESPQDVATRQQPVIHTIFQRPDEANILVCMHGRAMRIFISQLMKEPLYNMDQFRHTNVALYLLAYNDHEIPHLEKVNCTNHLQSLESANVSHI